MKPRKAWLLPEIPCADAECENRFRVITKAQIVEGSLIVCPQCAIERIEADAANKVEAIRNAIKRQEADAEADAANKVEAIRNAIKRQEADAAQYRAAIPEPAEGEERPPAERPKKPERRPPRSERRAAILEHRGGIWPPDEPAAV